MSLKQKLSAKKIKKLEVVESKSEKLEVPVKINKVAATTAGAGFLSDIKVVEFEGAEVVAILEQNENEKHCRMSDGTTKWVPNKNFQDQPDEN